MNILSLTITNFMAIGADCPAFLLANRGLNLIQGTNGQGKSSVVDALSWALFNVTARGESGDAVINNKVKKNCAVEVRLDDDGANYRITRYRKHKDHKNSVRVERMDGADIVDMTLATDKDTQGLIEQILGCSQEVFLAAIYAGQEAMPDLPKMTDKNLKAIIEEAAGVNQFERAYQLARDDVNEIKQKIDMVEAAMATTRSHLEDDKKSLADVEADIKTFDDGRAHRRDVALEGASIAKQKAASLAAEYQRLDVKKLEAALKVFSDKVASVVPAQKAVDEATRAVNAAVFAASKEETALQNIVDDVTRLKGQIANAPAEMKKPCPECGKPHTEAELEEFTQHLQARLDEAMKRAVPAAKSLKAAQAAVKIAEEALAKAKSAVPNVADEQAKVARINAALRKAADMKATLTSFMQGAKSSAQEAQNFMTEVNPYAASKELLMKRVAESEDRLKQGEVSRKVLEAKLAIAEDIAKVFSPAGVRAHILDTVTPFLNERTEDYLSIMSDGQITAVWSTLGQTAKGELREKFNIEVRHANGGASFGLLSGGEKRRVRLATVMALQDLQASRATKPIQLFIGDEIDDAIDEDGLERLMVILERRARERGTVIVISHNELQDWANEVTTMVKGTTGSVATGALVE